jgi:hypothetical protein
MPTPQQRSNKSITPKSNQGQKPAFGKENNKNVNNLILNDVKNPAKKSLSPLAKASNTPKVKKVEIKPSKSPAKNQFNSVKQSAKQVKVAENPCKIHKLFKHLTKCNPNGIKVLSP